MTGQEETAAKERCARLRAEGEVRLLLEQLKRFKDEMIRKDVPRE
jgi:hypothetical protein